MATEEVTTEEKSPSELETGADAEDIRDNTEDHNAGLEYESLFDDEAISDAELKGEEPATDDKKAASSESKGEEKDPEKGKADTEDDPEKSAKDKEAGDDAKAKTETEAKAKEDADTKADKEANAETEAKKAAEPEDVTAVKQEAAAKGEALRQERNLTKSLKAENQRLLSELESAKNPASDSEDAEFKEFEVLTTDKFRELLEEDPDEAAVYQHTLTRYQQYQTKLSDRKRAEQQAEQSEKDIVREGAEQIEKIIPGFHQDDNKEVQTLASFAVDNGLAPNVLFDLTNPKTRIVTGNGQKYTLGVGAAQVVGLIKGHHTASSKSINETELRETITAEVEAELRSKIEAEVQETLLEKMQQGTGGFKSLDSATQSGSKQTKGVSGPVTEAQLMNMSEAEERALLGG